MMVAVIDFVVKFVIFAGFVWFTCGLYTDCITSQVAFSSESGMWVYTVNSIPVGTRYRIPSGIYHKNPPTEYLKIPFLQPILKQDVDALEHLSICAVLHLLLMVSSASSLLVWIYGIFLAAVFVAVYSSLFVINALKSKTCVATLVRVLQDSYVLKLSNGSQICLEGTPPTTQQGSEILCGHLLVQDTYYEYSNKYATLLYSYKGAFFWMLVMLVFSFG